MNFETYKHLIKNRINDGDDAIIEFENLESQLIWESLDDNIHNGYSDNSYINQWVDIVYPNKKPPYYGVYQISGY